MEPREERVVLILADISGYTKFMVANQTAAVHGQVAITLLIETLLREVDIPLKLHGIEGDAVFLSASHPGDDAAWREVLAEVRTKLKRFFQVFLAAIVHAAEISPCECPSCHNVDQLKLKIIVHSGRAVFHTIAGLSQVAGTDVIIVHRLLKNSVPSGEYLLMTDAAYEDLGRGMGMEFEPGEELCEGIGAVRTWVCIMEAEKERARDAFYARPAPAVAADAQRYALWVFPATYRALFEQLRHPAVEVGWPRRIGFALAFVAQTLFMGPLMLFESRRHLLAKHAARALEASRGPATT
jgi:class 3 adenylate cyclase